ncbi:MAG: sigma-70 family RNA polymerase sigma factor [Planctomycetes bacterium]|nr:sigma-70 family RNA polymerase sigma factor [Planctomycetota bacterium]
MLPDPPAPEDASPGELDTQNLARAAKAGEEQRFGELYERIAPALFTWASVRIRPAMRGAVDPQDVVQEVWCRAWKAFPSFDPDEQSFRLWVFRIAKNVMLEAFRKVQRSGPKAGAAGSSTRAFQLLNVPDSATAVSRRVARHEGLAKLIEWIDALDEDEKKLVVFCGLEGLSYTEVGERIDASKDTVAKRWQALRARLASFGVPKELLVGE